MGFICHFCTRPQEARVKAHKVVTQYRQFNHPVRPKAMTRTVIKNGKKKKEYVTDPGGLGLQIVQEVLACPQCAGNWHAQQRERQSNMAPGESAKVIIPLAKPQAREYTPEPQQQRGGRRPYNDGPRPAFRPKPQGERPAGPPRYQGPRPPFTPRPAPQQQQ